MPSETQADVQSRRAAGAAEGGRAMKGAQAVAHCLKEQGVDTVFGYPGA